MRSSFTSVLPSVLGLTVGAGLCQAQLSGIVAGTGFQAAGSNVLYSTVFQNGVIGASHYSTVTTGDWSTFQAYPNGVSSWFATASGYDLFRAGPRPVEISNLRLAGNYKLVNSGGGDGEYAVTSQVSVGLAIRQRVGADINLGADPFIGSVMTTRPVLTGNGFVIDDFSVDAGAAPFVLTPGMVYYFQMAATVVSSGPVGYAGPQIGTTMEFGGPISAGTFAGFTSSFDYRAVPGPSVLAVMGIAGLAARRRR